MENCASSVRDASEMRKGAWSEEEDNILRQMVERVGTKAWTTIADLLATEHNLPGRSGKQCRERWRNHLGPINHLDSIIYTRCSQ